MASIHEQLAVEVGAEEAWAALDSSENRTSSSPRCW